MVCGPQTLGPVQSLYEVAIKLVNLHFFKRYFLGKLSDHQMVLRILLAFSIKINGYFGFFLYSLILKQKSVLRRSKQAAFLVKKNWDLLKQESWNLLMNRSMEFWRWKKVQTCLIDFLIMLGIKPRHHVIIRPSKMNNLLKVCKLCSFKVIFWHQKSTESFWFFFCKEYLTKIEDQLL